MGKAATTRIINRKTVISKLLKVNGTKPATL
jgi:hypothetical protein